MQMQENEKETKLKKAVLTLKRVAKRIVRERKESKELKSFASYLRGEKKIPNTFVPRSPLNRKRR